MDDDIKLFIIKNKVFVEVKLEIRDNGKVVIQMGFNDLIFKYYLHKNPLEGLLIFDKMEEKDVLRIEKMITLIKDSHNCRCLSICVN